MTSTSATPSAPAGPNGTVCPDEEIPPFLWLGLEFAVAPLEGVLVFVLIAATMLVTIVGNVLVILSVFNFRPLRIAQNFFIVSLAVADLMVAVLVLPFNLAYYLTGKWIFGIHACMMWVTSDVLCCTASILNLCAIALDRYWAITDPINYAGKRTVKRVTRMIFLTWIISAIISSPPLIGWNDWPDSFTDETPCRLTSEKGYVIYSALGSFFIPLIIMTVVYAQIFVATRRRLRERAKASNLNAVRLMGTDKSAAAVVIKDSESMSGDVHGENSFKVKKRKEDGDQDGNHLGLNRFRPTDDSTSDMLSICPGKNTSSEGDEVPVSESEPCNTKPKVTSVYQFVEERQRISLSKERKAARTLGIIMGVFVVCWLPFFLMYVIDPFCPSCCLSRRTINVITWLGYVNSALNPIIYTIFNMDFRKAFKKLLRINDGR